METNKIKIVTHNASFHADDVLACVTLSLVFDKENKEHEIIRSRDPKIIESGDFVVDVGGIYDPLKNRFDHHQKGGAGVRDNGIPYASFGLVWKNFGLLLCDGNEDLYEKIDNELVSSVDANDNGFDIVKNLYPNVALAPLPLSFMVEKLTWEERSEEMLYQSFTKAYMIAKHFLDRYIIVQKSAVVAHQEITKAYEEASDKKIIVFKKNYERINFMHALTKLPEILFHVYPDETSDTWSAETVPLNEGSFEKRKGFPKIWAGLHDKELAEVSGVPDAVFCHNSVFMCRAKTREGAMALAEIAIRS